MDSHVPVVPPRSWVSLEESAIGLTKRLAPECLQTPLPFPIAEVMQFRLNEIEESAEVEFGVASAEELGYRTAEGVVDWDVDSQRFKVLLSSRTFELMLSGDGRARQSAGHELGHFCEHRHIIRQMRESLSGQNPVSANAFFRGRKQTPPYMNAERQADVFGSRLLQPSITAIQVLSKPCINPVIALCDTFQVTPRNANVRLRELGYPG